MLQKSTDIHGRTLIIAFLADLNILTMKISKVVWPLMWPYSQRRCLVFSVVTYCRHGGHAVTRLQTNQVVHRWRVAG